jgi:hypothetical protein
LAKGRRWSAIAQRAEWVALPNLERWGVAYLCRYREISLQANTRHLDALAALDDPTAGKQALQRLTTTKKDAAGRPLERLFGRAVADAFRAPFVLGDANALRALCAEAGLAGAEVVQRQGTVHFASIDALVSTERACVWTLGGLLDDTQFERLRGAAQQVFGPFVDAGGKVVFAMPALVIRAARP